MDTLLRDGAVILGLMTVVIILFSVKIKLKISKWHIAGIMLFSMAMVAVFNLTGVSPLSGFHTDIRLDEISFIPIMGIVDMVRETSALAGEEDAPQMEVVAFLGVNIIGNIVLLAPLGFFLPLLWKKFRKAKKTILAGFLISLLIESSQLFLCRGTDVDDLILNTLGAALGYLCFVIFIKIFPKWNKQFVLDEEANSSLWRSMLYLCIFVPYIVTVLLGFYDRALLFAM